MASGALASERDAVLRVQQQQREAHLQRDAEAMVATMADDFVSINNGSISRPTRAQRLERFRDYFSSVRFLEWADVSEPHLQLSADGTMAWVAVHKRVRLVSLADGKESTTVFAWMSTYEKRKGRWVQTAVASTRVPEPKGP